MSLSIQKGSGTGNNVLSCDSSDNLSYNGRYVSYGLHGYYNVSGANHKVVSANSICHNNNQSTLCIMYYGSATQGSANIYLLYRVYDGHRLTSILQSDASVGLSLSGSDIYGFSNYGGNTIFEYIEFN